MLCMHYNCYILMVLIEKVSVEALNDMAVSIFGLTWISLLGNIILLLLTRPNGNYLF